MTNGGTMFCTGCGTQSADSDLFCGGCGNAQRNGSGKDAHLASTSAIFHVGQAVQQQAVPDGIKGWSWGAFWLNWIWAIGNNTWIGLLALIPYVNIPVMIWLGFKGREMAWRNRHWDNVEHFKRVQRAWSQWGVGIAIALFVLWTVCILIVVSASMNSSSGNTGEAVVQNQVNGSATLAAN
jgi:hypothetical protein